MKEEVDIQCAKSFDKHLLFHRPARYSGDAATALRVSIKSGDLKAWLWARCNYRLLVEFFYEMARDWKGWNGEKVFRSDVGEMVLTATSDRLGHITLDIKLSATNQNFSIWNLATSIVIEAGRLEALEHDVKELLSSEGRA